MSFSFLQAFSRMRELVKDDFQIIGDALIVEKIFDDQEQEKKTKGGIVIPKTSVDPYGKPNQINSMAMDLPMFVRVVATGEGYYDDETKESVPLDTKPGNIILVGRQSVQFFTSFGDLDINTKTFGALGLTRECERKLCFKDDKSFREFFNGLNQEFQNKG